MQSSAYFFPSLADVLKVKTFVCVWLHHLLQNRITVIALKQNASLEAHKGTPLAGVAFIVVGCVMLRREGRAPAVC